MVAPRCERDSSCTRASTSCRASSTPATCVVVNTSAQIPAALPATGRTARRSSCGSRRRCRTAAGSRSSGSAPEPFAGGVEGERLALPGGAHATLVGRYLGGRRLWLTELELPAPLDPYLAEHGRPIRYGYVSQQWPLEAYRNVYALEPGSAEPPSAGRPFTHELLTRLVAKGVLVAPLVLHTGVSSLERGEPPYPEWIIRR